MQHYSVVSEEEAVIWLRLTMATSNFRHNWWGQIISGKFTFWKKASFSLSSLAEEGPGEVIRALPSSLSSEASVFYSHVDKSTWLLQQKKCFSMFITIHFINTGSRVLSGLRFISSESTGWNGCWKHVWHIQIAMLFFWVYILSLNKYL